MNIEVDGVLSEDPLRSISEIVSASRVAIINGITGIGKSTLIPMWLAKRENVWVSQPRRISVLNSFYLVHDVYKFAGSGYKIRFSEYLPREKPSVMFATDGETIQHIHDIKDTLVVDEAHERSAIQDVVIALAKKRLESGELQHLVIQSATLSVRDFMEYFKDFSPSQINITGKRKYNVFIKWNGGLIDLKEIHDEYPREYRILIFREGLAEIEKTAYLLSVLLGDSGYEIIKLHSQLTDLETFQRVIRPPERKDIREIIIATNIAETSFTPANCIAVLDNGYKKETQYISGIVTLKRVRISKSSAIQRAGRVGRVMDGFVIREYDQLDYNAFPERDTPEILRIPAINLVFRLLGYNLRMEKLDLMDTPPSELVEKAYRWLMLYRFVDSHGRLTKDGRAYTEFPDDPKFARILHNIVTKNPPRWIPPLLIGGLLFITNNVIKIDIKKDFQRERDLLDVPEAMLYFAEFWMPDVNCEYYQFANSLLSARKKIAKERGLIYNKAIYSLHAMKQLLECFNFRYPELSYNTYYLSVAKYRGNLEKSLQDSEKYRNLIAIISSLLENAFPVIDLSEFREISTPPLLARVCMLSRYAKSTLLDPLESHYLYAIKVFNMVGWGVETHVTKWHPFIQKEHKKT